MRLHRLTMTAFGPFAGTEQVDFDALSASGLFLLHGPTGAGKTSVLDAVCYALYGQVPGARSTARPRLRSDHAPADREPRVQLELTVAGRRLEVTRTPEWSRPKKRGAGTTSAPAATRVRERVDGEWLPVTSRMDEAAQLLLDLLGMGHEQFTKVVLLPQGEFAAFLRADADTRRAVLMRLFSIERFAAVENALAERRRQLGADVEVARQLTGRLLARAGEAFAGLPVTDEGSAGEHPVESKASRQVAGLLARAETLARAAQVELEGCTERAGAVHALLAAGTLVAARRQRWVTITDQLTELDADAAAQVASVARVTLARRAAPLVGLVDALDAARGRTTLAAAAERAARPGVPTSLRDGDQAALRLAADAARSAIGALEGAGDRLAELGTLRARIAVLCAEHATALAGAAAADLARAAAAHEIVRARTAHQAATLAAADHAAAVRARTAAVQVAEWVVELIECEAAVAAVELAAHRAVDADHDARELQLALWQQRIDGIAGELAAELAPGQACRVCGGVDHPAPAVPIDAVVGRDAVVAARAATDRSRATRDAAAAAVADARRRQAELVARTGGVDAAAAAQALLAAEARLTDAGAAGDRVDLEAAAITVADAALHRAEADRGECTDLAARCAASLAELTATAEATAADLDRLRGDDADVRQRAARLQAEIGAVDALLEVVGELSGARSVVEGQSAALAQACHRLGFADEGAVRDAAVVTEQLELLAAATHEHERRRGDLVALLADPEVATAAGQADPDLDALRVDVLAADRDHSRAAAHHALTHDGVRRLVRLLREATDHENATAPLLDRFAQVDGLCACVQGSGGDNALRMRLSAYVLAARLEEVAAAATERLAVMSDGRYALVHSDERVKGGGRSGLGLRVVDAWTGVERDTATLSGGESFVASLALALGLADVVQAESHGAAIETLFVDEGFGSLDDETLDEVMTTLDGLRDGGRAVGLVSHVSDLRARIPTQLEVHKSRGGSTLRLHCAP